MCIAIIPARGGSKRIPHKNIKPFFGKPLIQYSIQAAIDSGIFTEIIVTTDSPEIAKVAVQCGATVPALRPVELANDFVATAPVLVHAINELARTSNSVQYACCILATAPFVRSDDIKKGFEQIKEQRAGALFSMTTFPYPVFRSLKENSQGKLQYLWPEFELARSNDLPEAIHDAGQFYWFNIEKFLAAGKMMIPNDTVAYMLPRSRVQDIDTPEDWEAAESLYRLQQLSPSFVEKGSLSL